MKQMTKVTWSILLDNWPYTRNIIRFTRRDMIENANPIGRLAFDD